jgi:hypothetical protein
VKEDRAGGDDAVRPALPAGTEPPGPEAAAVADLHRQLIGLRRRHPWLADAAIEEPDLLTNEVLAVRLTSGPRTVAVRAGAPQVVLTAQVDGAPPVGCRAQRVHPPGARSSVTCSTRPARTPLHRGERSLGRGPVGAGLRAAQADRDLRGRPMGVAFLLTWLLREVPLRGHGHTAPDTARELTAAAAPGTAEPDAAPH